MKNRIGKWLVQNGIKTNKAQEIEFDDHAFLWDYFNDDADRIVVQKCTQIGVSSTTIWKILYQGGKENLSIVYTLPTGGEVKDFVRTKFDPTVENSLLQDKVHKNPVTRRAVYSTVLKKIAGSHYFFRGSFSEHRAQAVDADILVVDELDFQKPDIREMYEERLKGAKSKNVVYWIGTPSFPNFGIADLYNESDQRRWFIRCPHCKKLQTLTWPENISFQKKSIICQECREDLPKKARKTGTWIAKYPSRKTHGYYFNRLMAPWIDGQTIIDSYHKRTKKHFFNFSLGMPHIEETQRFRREEFQAAYIQEAEFSKIKKDKLIIGIDQGNHFHLIAGYGNEKIGVVVTSKVLKSPEDLEESLEKLRPDMVVMDQFPDQHYARQLQKKFGPDKFILVNQRLWSRRTKTDDYLKYDRGKGLINLEKTEGLDHLFDAIRATRLKFRASAPRLEMVYSHFRNLIPDVQKRFGRRRKVYKKVGQEDFAHATNYFYLGLGILFPDVEKGEVTNIVPASEISESPIGSEKWLEKDLEKQVRKLTQPKGHIHIPPKR